MIHYWRDRRREEGADPRSSVWCGALRGRGVWPSKLGANDTEHSDEPICPSCAEWWRAHLVAVALVKHNCCDHWQPVDLDNDEDTRVVCGFCGRVEDEDHLL